MLKTLRLTPKTNATNSGICSYSKNKNTAQAEYLLYRELCTLYRILTLILTLKLWLIVRNAFLKHCKQ